MPNDRAPLVSIIVPTYNCEGYIKQALDSILMQECDFSYEILIGDDASTDGTPQILLDYAARHECIKLFLRETNLGAAKNCIELLKTARGKYLATLEGDDIWNTPSKLQKQVDFLENNDNYIGCATKVDFIDKNSNRINFPKPIWIKYRKKFGIKDFKGIFLPGQPSSYVRRNIFLTLDNSLKNIADFHPMILDRTLMLLYLTKGNFYLFGEKMSSYRVAYAEGSQNSATQKVYGKNSIELMREYEYNIALEELFYRLTSKKASFRTRRLMLMAECIIQKTRKNKEAKNVMRLLTSDGALPKWQYVFSVLYIIRKATLHVGTRVMFIGRD